MTEAVTIHDGLIDNVEKKLLGAGVELLDLPTCHRFTPGLYLREVELKKGSVWTTRQHKTEHPFVMLTGRVSVYSNGTVQQIVAPYLGITKPGTRRIIVVHEDAVWVTFHPTAETDLEKIEESLVEPWPVHLSSRHSLQPPRETKGELP